MEKFSMQPPSDKQIDQIILDSAVSGRLFPNDLDMLVHYIRALRDKGGQRGYYITSRDETGK